MKVTELIKLCEASLYNSRGAYRALRLITADESLPGLKSCEDDCETALKEIKNYLTKHKHKFVLRQQIEMEKRICTKCNHSENPD